MPGVEQFGYGRQWEPRQRYGVSTRGVDNARSVGNQAIVDECSQTPTVQQFWPSTDLDVVTPDFFEQAMQSDAGQAVLGEWDACLAVHGLHRFEAGGRWAVTDGKRNSGDTPAANGEPLDVTSAVVDAQCKADVELVPRLAQLIAELQVPFIEAHHDELTAIRAALRESLAHARSYAAEQG
jgi:hypothetical protein